MPAIVDHDVDGEPVSVFESGAILFYLAEKTGRFMPTDSLRRKETLEWLFWQVGGLGPMAGQVSNFVNYAPQDGNEYSRVRYANEYNRCIGVLERRLEGRKFIVGDYSIADIASWPWIMLYKKLLQTLDNFPNVAQWHDTMRSRPQVRAGIDVGKEFRRQMPPNETERKILFGQTAASTATMATKSID